MDQLRYQVYLRSEPAKDNQLLSFAYNVVVYDIFKGSYLAFKNVLGLCAFVRLYKTSGELLQA